MNIVKITMSAIKNRFLINAVAILLLSLLFCAELSLYHYFYYDYVVVQARYRTDFSRSTYTFEFAEPLEPEQIDTIIKNLPDPLGQYEDIVLCNMSQDGEDIGINMICYYDGMSPLHDLKSDDSSQVVNNDIIETQNLVATNDFDAVGSVEINGSKYRLIQYVKGLNGYVNEGIPTTVLLCSKQVFMNGTDGIDKVFFEYRSPLSNNESDSLIRYIETYANVKNSIIPQGDISDTVDAIGNIYEGIIEAILVMFIITTCVLPIIRYCLWKRHHEFRSYRMCGADQSFIVTCEMAHILILGLGAVAAGTLLSAKYIQTRGFWLLYIIGVVVFILRLLIEVMIDSRSSSKIMEVNKKWKL